MSWRRVALVSTATIASLMMGFATSNIVDPSPASTPPDELQTLGSVDSSDLTFPRTIGQYALVEVEDYDEVELGVGLKFSDRSSPDHAFDVYVYPISKHRLASLADVLEREHQSVQAGIEVVAKRQGWVAEPSAANGQPFEALLPGFDIIRTSRP